MPSPKDEAHKKWREDWLKELLKSRESDSALKERIKNDRVFICERHFEAEDIEICKFEFVYSLRTLCCALVHNFWC